MRISFEWIKDFVDIAASPEDTAHRLTRAGLEIEGMESIDGDVVMEVNVTPNRPDCLNILGLAREVAAAFGLPLKKPQARIEGACKKGDIRVEIDASDLCSRYTGRVIKGVTVSESPDWMKKRLEKCGVRAINNVVDITNYVLLELGHPLHAFDADKISDRIIRVAKAGKNKSISTLDSVERKLPEETLLIWDGRGPVAIAGIMGGEGSSVDADTINIFLESAYFDPASIRRSSKNLGLKSESSYRFERGTDREFLETALNRASILMQEIAGGVIHEIADVYPGKYVPVAVEVPYRKVNSLLGTNLEKQEMLGILEMIEITTRDRGDSFTAFPPAFRGDIKEPVDVIEEIARCYGYEKITATAPKTPLPDGILNKKERNLDYIKEAVRKSGFTEVINYSFMNSDDLDLLSIPKDDRRRRFVTLRNPLRQEDSLMRTTLAPSLINNFLYNLARGARKIAFYELSRVFIDEGSRLPGEELRLAGIFFRENSPAVWQEQVPSFFIVKGALQALFEEMKAGEYTLIPSDEVFLHKGKSADIICKEQKIGFIGEISPHIIERLNLKIKKPEIVIFELSVDILLSLIEDRPVYAQIPKYPSIERDIALVVDDLITSGEILGLLRGYNSPVIESIELFDYYKGKNIPMDKKSLGFRIVYRSKDRTLTDSEVESVHGDLVAYILKKTAGELRG
ncbi:MAG: phenylalanine--tRNA ligase subunit beta [Nitrospira bacterium HGW-Nitrospira-1]|nr:MAG: phenylalanine--tRNA ligase subunit beta [Nitrospira bacterium HGW-Nitrospira-1]